MKITDFNLYHSKLKLANPLVLKGGTVETREGLALRLTDADGATGWGETSPLAGFSVETLESTTEQLVQLKSKMLASEVPTGLERLNGAFDNWLGRPVLFPSVRFGIESAVLNLLADATQTPLPALIGGAASASVAVNGLLMGTPNEIIERARQLRAHGFQTLKLKVGSRTIDEDINLLKQVRETVGNDIKLRLDANRSWDYEDAATFMRRAADFDVEYIEEPARNLDQLRKLIYKTTPPIPVALDESLSQINPKDLSSPYHISAVVIKPTMLGLERAVLFARASKENGITSVISSAFESSLGIYTLASLAAVVQDSKTAAGLDTLSRFAEDLCANTVKVENGRINLETAANVTGNVRLDMLKEIA